MLGSPLAQIAEWICLDDMRTNDTCGNDNRLDEFHAGRFLRDLLQEEGHDMAWLANRLSMPLEILGCILEQPNMDAELFVRMGYPMQPLFMQRVDEMIFGERTK